MRRFLVLNGPNLNWLGRREPGVYGTTTMADVERRLAAEAERLGVALSFFQSNHEGALIDYLQANADDSDGIIINPGALTHYGLSLRDALASLKCPIVEVHISNVYAREDFRKQSLIAPVATGQISGLGWRVYGHALRALVELTGDDEPHVPDKG